MEEYSFVDIFATKGVEYLVVIAYFLLLILFAKKLNAPSIPPTEPGKRSKNGEPNE